MLTGAPGTSIHGAHASPRDLALQVAVLLAVGADLLDGVPLDQVPEYLTGLGPWLEGRLGPLLARLRDTRLLNAADRHGLLAALRERAQGLTPGLP